MSLWIDEIYVKQLAYRLEGFKQIDHHQWNCRCIICGDSQKKKSKKRGYFFEHNGAIFYKCFNCSAAMQLGKFLKDFDHNLYQQYRLDKFKDSPRETVLPVEKQEPEETNALGDIFCNLPRITELPQNHFAREYLTGRKIPYKFLKEMYYCKEFVKWTSKFTDKYEGIKEHPRAIIPFYDENKELIYFQGRSFGKIEPRYFTFKVTEKDVVKVFGLDKLDKSKPRLVLEGPIDSMFLQNAVAVACADLTSYVDGDCIYIFDNEPRNPDICRLLGQAIEAGKKVVIWPKYIAGMGKDVNELVLNGVDVESIIKENTFQGLSARLKYNDWKR